MYQKYFTLASLTAVFTMVFVYTGWAVIPAPPVNQNLGIGDSVFNQMVETDCRYCHNQVPPSPYPVDPTYLPDRHHLRVGTMIMNGSDVPYPDANGDGINETAYECLNCHRIEWDPAQSAFVITQNFRNCTSCHVQNSGEETVHHRTAESQARNCTHCHGSFINNFDDGHYIPTYQPSLVTPWPSRKDINGDGIPDSNTDVDNDGVPDMSSAGTYGGNCNFCHNTATGGPGAPTVENSGPFDPVLVYRNDETHHSTGLFGSTPSKCFWCHDVTPPSHSGISIRTCEECHGVDTLHNIQFASQAPGLPTDGTVIPGQEAAGSGHIGNDQDCRGCHGFDATVAQSMAPYSGPVVPGLYSLSASSVQAGSSLTLLGTSFVNLVENPLTGEYDQSLNCEVVLIDSSGNPIVILPNSVTGDTMEVTVPADTPAGNYQVVARKFSKDSNPLGLSITPAATINHVTCNNGQALIGGSGFSSYLDAADSGTSVTADVVTGTGKNGKPVISSETGSVFLWSDTWIMAVFSACPEEGTVTVSTVFDAGQSTSDGNKGKGKGGGKNK